MLERKAEAMEAQVTEKAAGGPLDGLRIIELAGLGPGPLCAMLLGDLGAEVIRVDRLGSADAILPLPAAFDVVNRGRRPIALDLKSAAGQETLLRLVEQADALIEGFRPGVSERLGIGPDVCHARNPRLVYGRITGYGQTGLLAQSAGHDINYISLTGALHSIRRVGEKPIPPLNLVGDYGGGAMFLAVGMLAALFERTRSGQGQVVDAAMVEGAAVLMGAFFALSAAGSWSKEPGTNLLDTGAPFYDVYETSDAKFVAVGALEPKFFAELARRIGLDERFVRNQMDRRSWPELRERLAAIFRTRPRDAWREELEGTDCCVTAVLSLDEAPTHPHNRSRGVFQQIGDAVHPSPAPRFSRSATRRPCPPLEAGSETERVLRDFGFAEAEIAALRKAHIIA